MTYSRHPQSIVENGAHIGAGTRIWAFTNIKDGAVIGHGCNICDGCYVEKGAVIGHHVTVKNNVALYDGITLEDDVFVGTGTSFINDRHPRSHRPDAWALEKTLIRRGATIGSGSVILCGITVGEYAVIGAGSVVTKDVPPATVVAGNPAVFLGYACRCGKRLNEQLACVCGLKYCMTDNRLESMDAAL